MTKTLPKIISDTKSQVQEAQRTPSKINVKKKKTTIPRHIIFKLQKTKNKEKLSQKKWEEKKLPLEKKDKNSIWLLRNHESKKRLEWNIYIQCWEKRNNWPKILYPVKLPFQSEGDIKTLRQRKIERICCQKTCLLEMLKEVLQIEEN